ncbi:transposase [Bradyrhizobium sp. SRL28]|uniref:transposase n=1 Tax=Bradyrhizobium sp. SRL28 TaxID=2836178 RepID=UPI0035B420A9
MTVPGVGPVATLSFKVAVDDPRRFARSRMVASLCFTLPFRPPEGLSPLSDSSDRSLEPIGNSRPARARVARIGQPAGRRSTSDQVTVLK